METLGYGGSKKTILVEIGRLPLQKDEGNAGSFASNMIKCNSITGIIVTWDKILREVS